MFTFGLRGLVARAVPLRALVFASLRVPGGVVIVSHYMWAYWRMPHTVEERDRRKSKVILSTFMGLRERADNMFISSAFLFSLA